MRPTDIAIFTCTCFVWALNLIVSRVLLSEFGVAPIFYAAVRFALVAALLSPLLRPIPAQLGRVIIVGTLMGAGHFGLMFLALASASSGSVAVVLQTATPITAILSYLILSEIITARMAAGIALALGGVVLVIWQPGTSLVQPALLLAVASAASLALGSVLLKRVSGLAPFRFQAWAALVSFPPLMAFSWFTEGPLWLPTLAIGWPFWAGLAFSALIVTLISHTLYIRALQLYPASVVAPLALLVPLMTIALDVLLLGEALTLPILAGTAIAIAGFILVLRGQPTARLAPSAP